MQKQFLLFLCILACSWSQAQVVSTSPSIPVEGRSLTITFRADEGTKGLKGYTGDVYAHTGVITSESTGSGDWKYVVSDWGLNVPKAKLTRIATDLYELSISPDIRSYYGVPAGEDILQMVFVFRSASQVAGAWKEGKAVGGSDIFIDVYKEGLTALLSSPVNNSLFLPNQEISVNASGLNSDGLRLFLDDVLIKQTTESELTYAINAPASGAHVLRLEAYKGADIEESIINFYIREAGEIAAMPPGLAPGLNLIDDNSVNLMLPAPGKEYIYVLGDFNNWAPTASSQMKKDGDYFWLTIEGLEPGVEYAYQYYIDGTLRLADPFTYKVLDQHNDKYIPETVYPNLKPFPSEYASGLVSVFETNPPEYIWTVENFALPEKEKLVIYEVLIRDFTDNGDIKTITDSLDYFVRLGVNAIELMPFNEFEGNDSWGYNPSFFFAADKAYGTINDYKEFIDECHKRGIAVIMDIVLNHSFGQSPLLQMYFDGSKPAADSPWYNVNHNMQNTAAQWGYDFNHESVYTQELVDRVIAYWIEEFKVDGFRFDFTKGFTNTIYGPSSWASEYDASRIAILKRMASQVWSNKADALVIFEHLSDNPEEKELADYGIMLWGNMNYNFSEAVMGYNDGGKSNFSWSSYKQRGWNNPNLVAYMESHDEERVTFKAISYGDVLGAYSVKDLNVALERHKAAAAFLFSVPGPKMIWQFGEMGYDISIDQGGRLGKKPPKWEYMKVPARKKLWDVYAGLAELKTSEPVFATSNFTMDVSSAVKKVELNDVSNDVRLVGNFDMVARTVKPDFSSTGTWYNHFQGVTIDVDDVEMDVTLQPGEFAMFTRNKFDSFVVASSLGKDKLEGQQQAEVFPNPVKTELHVMAGQEVVGLQIFDIHGRSVAGMLESSFNPVMDVSYLMPGFYLLRIEMADGKIEYHKVSK